MPTDGAVGRVQQTHLDIISANPSAEVRVWGVVPTVVAYNPVPKKQIEMVFLEVLTPSTPISSGFIGWGIPL